MSSCRWFDVFSWFDFFFCISEIHINHVKINCRMVKVIQETWLMTQSLKQKSMKKTKRPGFRWSDSKQKVCFYSTGGPPIVWFLVPKGNHKIRVQNFSKVHFLSLFFHEIMMFFSHWYTILNSILLNFWSQTLIIQIEKRTQQQKMYISNS